MASGAFIFLSPGANSAEDRATVKTQTGELVTVAVASYEDGAAVAKELVEAGCKAVELCGGFGTRGLLLVTEAVAGRAAVGVVRFDVHPALGGKSGDSIF